MKNNIYVVKHLKSYNESLVSDAKKECNDILIELRDLGFKTLCTINTWAPSFELKDPDHIRWVVINISYHKIFQFRDIEDVIFRIEDYLKTQGLFIQHEINKKIIEFPINDPRTFRKTGSVYRYELTFTECKELSESFWNWKRKVKYITTETREKIEDCLYDLVDISNPLVRSQDSIGSYRISSNKSFNNITELYRFKFKEKMSEDLFNDYMNEIKGRVSDIDNKLNFYYPHHLCSRFDGKSWKKEMPAFKWVIDDVTLIFTYIKMNKEEIEKCGRNEYFEV